MTSDGAVNGCDNADSLKTIAAKGYHSAIARHLSLDKECAKAYCDDCYSVLSRARSRRHLEVLESIEAITYMFCVPWGTLYIYIYIYIYI